MRSDFPIAEARPFCVIVGFSAIIRRTANSFKVQSKVQFLHFGDSSAALWAGVSITYSHRLEPNDRLPGGAFLGAILFRHESKLLSADSLLIFHHITGGISNEKKDRRLEGMGGC